MANNYGDEQVVCPFFYEQRKTEILCADEYQSGSSKEGRFRGFHSSFQKDNWMNNYCTGFLYSTCPTYREFEERWNQKQGGEKR